MQLAMCFRENKHLQRIIIEVNNMSKLNKLMIVFIMLFTLANFNPATAQQTVEDQYWNLVEDSESAKDFE
jgi:hypothetical protein